MAAPPMTAPATRAIAILKFAFMVSSPDRLSASLMASRWSRAEATISGSLDSRYGSLCPTSTFKQYRQPPSAGSGTVFPSGSVRQSFCDDIRTLLGDHDGGRMNVRRWHRRHDGSVRDPQALDAAHAQCAVDHRVIVLAHPAGAAGMKHGRADPADIVGDFLVAVHVGSWPQGLADQRMERIGRRD